MRASFRITPGIVVTTAAAAMISAGVLVACSSEEAKPAVIASPCTPAPGTIPPADCDDSTNDCTGSGCTIDEARCGSASTCLPTVDNKGKQVVDLRLRKLKVVAPPALAETFIENIVIGRNIDLDAKSCGEKGTGSFSWLLRVDRANNKLITGGAPPSADPFGVGFCFAHDVTDGIEFGPSTVDIEFTGNTFQPLAPIPKLNIPIYIDGNPDNVILLPISNGTFRDITLSDDGNCIGSFDTKGLNEDCAELRGACTKWKTAGALGGYITLEEADKVILKDLQNRTLCSYLTGDTANKTCKGSGNTITAKGDYCSTTNAAGGCADSYWLAATFAAAAVKVHDGADVRQCNGKAGTTSTDAGTD